ncbi:MAG: tRNA (adenine-N1)-methyltransferase [Ancrocorticia sp.]
MSQSTGDRRRGPFRAGERVQLTDPKGRQYTISLTRDGYFQSTRGSFRHSALIGAEEGTVLETEDGRRFLALRPLVSDYVLSMPRGATVVYPKDAAQIVHMADIFPGARVFEAGVGSGALSLSLLGAVGANGHLLSAERRPEFAEIARGNVESWYGPDLPPWDVEIGDAADVLDGLEPGSLDHVILDMLAPWEIIDSAAHALRSGGVILVYVATTTQMSRFVEDLRSSESFTEPAASETLVRTWHLEGLAVRPDHRMIGHTGFLVVARKLSGSSEPLVQKRRPAKAAYSEAPAWVTGAGDVARGAGARGGAGVGDSGAAVGDGGGGAESGSGAGDADADASQVADESRWAADLGERTIAPKKLRRVRRDVAHRADVEETGESAGGRHGQEIREKIEAELAERNASS